MHLRLHNLQRPLSVALRRILSLGPTFPTDVIYMACNLCGVGAPFISDLCQLQKWSSLQNSLAAGGEAEKAVDDILFRAYSNFTGNKGKYQFIALPPKGHPESYLTSLIQWLHRAGMVIARMDPDEHVETKGTSEFGENLSSLNQVAYELGLDSPPDEGMVNPLDLDCASIFSDASYKLRKTSVRSLASNVDPCKAEGRGAAAIMFMPRGMQHRPWTEKRTRIVRITARNNEAGMNNYSWELLGIACALRLAKNIPHFVPVFNDCKGAIARAMRAQSYKGRAVAHLNKGILCASIPVPTASLSRPVLHVLGHPERPRKPKQGPTPPQTFWEQWSVKQKGIFIADAAAENDLRTVHEKIGHNVKWSHISLDELTEEIIPVGRWHIRDTVTNRPVLGDIKKIHDEFRARRYLVNRDAYRARRGEASYWKGVHLDFAAYCWEPSSQDKGVWGNAKRSKWVLDKGAHGRTMAKGKKDAEKTEAEKCKLCGMIDSQRHMLCECRGSPIMSGLREKAKDAQSTILHRIIQGTKGVAAPPLWIRQALIKYRTLCWDGDGEHLERLWLGTWNDDTIKLITGEEDMDRMVDFMERQIFRKCVREVMSPLRELAPTLLTIRMEAITQKLGANKESAKTQRRRRFPVVHPLTKSGFVVAKRKSTRWTEFVKLPEALTSTMTQRTIPQMFKTPLDVIPESVAEDEDEEEIQPVQDTLSEAMTKGSANDRNNSSDVASGLSGSSSIGSCSGSSSTGSCSSNSNSSSCSNPVHHVGKF